MFTGRQLSRSTKHGMPVLSCEISDSPDGRPIELWIRAEHLKADAPNWDPFLPALALFAGAHGSDLNLEGPASPALVRQAMSAQRVWQQWTKALQLPAIQAVTIHTDPARQRSRVPGTGAFFSGGVDSFYTLLTNHQKYAAGDPRRISRLVLIHGLDIALDNSALFVEARKAAEDVASAVGVRLAVVETNIRSIVKRIDWVTFAHAPCLMAGALASAELFDSVLVPAAYAAHELKPNAVHPALDPLWSTEYVDVVHHGIEATRGDKVHSIASSPIALKHLRVCWENPGNSYNCGRCEKCLRTMLDLWVAGVLEQSQTFPRHLDEDALTAITIPSHLVSFWNASINRARGLGRDPAVIDMLSRTVHRSEFDRSLSGSVVNGLLGLSRGLGVTPARLKALDTKIAGGVAQRALRHLQGRAAKGRR